MTYDTYAPWYDMQNSMDDVSFYLDAIQTYGDPVLDAGSGTGRLLTAFAREGYAVQGFDNSNEMLARARKKIEKESPEVQELIQMRFGDLREFYLNQQFQVAMFGCNTFQHLLTNEDQDKALRCMYHHLSDSGRLFIQTTNVKFHEHDPDVLYHRGREYDQESKTWIDSFYSYHYHQQVQIQQFTLFLDILGEDERIQRKQVVLNLRFCFPPELERILYANGFEIEAMYGDFQKNPVTRDSPWIIVQAYKRKMS